MSEKVKNGASNRSKNRIFIAGVLVAGLVGSMIGFFIKPMPVLAPVDVSTSSPRGDETVIVSLTSAEPIVSAYTYSGIVTMLVTGTGQVSGSDYSDAFYAFMNVERELLMPPIMQYDFTLEIDGESAYNHLNLSPDMLPFSPTHRYVIRYDVGPASRHITLRTSDRGVSDNTGELQVTIFDNASWLQKVAPFVPTPIPESVVASKGGEMVVVPFTSGSPIYTDKLYSGNVTLLICGTGQAGGQDTSDAFYLYERGDHSPYVPPVLGDFAMELDGQKIHEMVGIVIPAYASDHHYRVTYNVGPEPRRIGFRNTDLSTGDNSGAYYVEVISSQ